MDQSEVVVELTTSATKDLGIKSLPAFLPEVAFQPAARGGIRHFTAGNIRIVKKARELLWEQEWIGVNNMTEEEWKTSLERFFEMPEKDRGNFEREQLVVACQDIYLCAICTDKQYV